MTTETQNIFEQASRQKLRFDTGIGLLSVEDLWNLPLSTTNSSKPNLDAIAVDLNKALKGTEESFVSNKKKDAILQLKFDLVKHIIDTRMQEVDAKTKEAQRSAQIGKIDELIAAKEDAALSELTIEQLQDLKKGL
ncbi:hypothetical protein RYA05_02780 [Pseudomonas syringae pv. actinidiae]|nr:hypothetical protein [Pseudomonas syringae pv. actinidiae]